ncbi:MAG: hypothetical protein PHW72_01780 [Candidatus Pacebacteria bacterium]|nr:hypothetical protein [Candidatus Paceibacterota bacterium]
MTRSSKPLIEHVPCFLKYCKDIGLSYKTLENYGRYLNKFIFWLKKENKTGILPHQLSIGSVAGYKLFLSQFKDKNGAPLKVITQHYYLIALRALLGYFTAKDIVSLLPDKIDLPRAPKREKNIKPFTEGQIQTLLNSPDSKTASGLRDRAILSTFIYSGLKINQLTRLNKNEASDNCCLTNESLKYIKEYLDARNDTYDAMFINYQTRTGARGRLSSRSIERIISYYGKKAGLPFLITPESLRWLKVQSLLDAKLEIHHPEPHRKLQITNFLKLLSNSRPPKDDTNKEVFSWGTIENAIKNETAWLKGSLAIMPESYKDNPPLLKSDDLIFRKIVILVLSGRVKLFEFDGPVEKSSISEVENNPNQTKFRHGKEWHNSTMKKIHNYLVSKGCRISTEPQLSYGRADLGVISPDGKISAYIEVGTVSLFKLWYNLSVMNDVSILVIPSENKMLKFII